MQSLIQSIQGRLRNLVRSQDFLFCMLSSLFFGFAAHSYAFFNKLSMHDEIKHQFDIGTTWTSGRWFLGLLDEWTARFFASGHYSTPVLNGIFTIVLLGLCAFTLVRTLDIRRKAGFVLVSGLMVVTPSMVGLFGYMFTAPAYMLALMMSLVGAWLLCKYHTPFSLLPGAFLIACGAGIYQAYLPVVLCVLLMHYIHGVVTARHWDFGAFFRQLFWYTGSFLTAMGLYYLLTQLFLRLRGVSLSGYMGISQMGTGGISHYLKLVKQAMYFFLYPYTAPVKTHVLPFGTLKLYFFSLALCALYCGLVLWHCLRENPKKALCILPAMAVFPLATNFIFVMCDSDSAHILMVYAHIMLFVALYSLSEHTPLSFRLGRAAVILVLSVLLISYVRYDNICYSRFQFYQTRSTQVLNRLISRIESTEGYDPAMPVAYIGKHSSFHIETFRDIEPYEEIVVMPFAYYNSVLAAPSWKTYMHYWCGFQPELADSTAFQDLPQVRAMPAYPADGSIAIINDTVVVKLS